MTLDELLESINNEANAAGPIWFWTMTVMLAFPGGSSVYETAEGTINNPTSRREAFNTIWEFMRRGQIKQGHATQQTPMVLISWSLDLNDLST